MGRRGALVAALAAALAFLWGAADSLRPYAMYERDVTQSTPGLGALDSRYTLELKRGDEACVEDVTMTPRSHVARFRLLVRQGDATPPVEVTASGPGYRSSTTMSGYPAGGDVLSLATLTPPEREVDGKVCARNAGRIGVELVGAQDLRSLVPAKLVLNGEEIPGKDVELTLLERERRSLVERPGDLVDHAREFTAGYAPTWLLWILLVLVAGGVPAAAIGGLFLAIRRDGGYPTETTRARRPT